MAVNKVICEFEGEALTLNDLYSYLKTIQEKCSKLPATSFDAKFWATHEVMSAGVVGSATEQQKEDLLVAELKKEEVTVTRRSSLDRAAPETIIAN